MSDEQLRLMAAILDALCRDQARYLIRRHPALGIRSGGCRSCGALARIEPDGESVHYEHAETCVLMLNARLQQSLQVAQEEANEP